MIIFRLAVGSNFLYSFLNIVLHFQILALWPDSLDMHELQPVVARKGNTEGRSKQKNANIVAAIFCLFKIQSLPSSIIILRSQRC